MRSILLLAAFIAAHLGSPSTACSQHYYVVIGAFVADDNASEFKAYLPDGRSVDTSYSVSDQKNLLHFYVLKTADKEAAVSKTLHLKNEIESWRLAADTNDAHAVERIVTGNVVGEAGPSIDVAMNESATASASVSNGLANAGNIPPRPVGKYFKFRVETPEGTPLAAKVHHVDFENGLELASYNTNTFVDLLRPGRRNEPMAVVCGVFGYKEIHKYIDYADPTLTDEEAYRDSLGVWVIPYKLERLEKGDVSIMYNLSFYKDAAIMKKESRVDLDELVKMMHSNPYYEITIHAHCNGKNKRELIAPGPDRNYFDLDGSVKLTGSARNLTALRAEAIRNYLADHGIDARRITIFPRGGSDMLVKANNAHAYLNDRVEIEVMRD